MIVKYCSILAMIDSLTNLIYENEVVEILFYLLKQREIAWPSSISWSRKTQNRFSYIFFMVFNTYYITFLASNVIFSA